MSDNAKTGVRLHIGEGPVSLEEMQDITDVFMNAIGTSFAGKAIDGRALAGTLLAVALGVLRDIKVEDPKAVAHEYIRAADLAGIMPFSPPRHG